jgi:hypothetical protein
MQNKPGPGFWSLCSALFWRWVIVSALAWVAGFIFWLFVTLIIGICIALVTGATTKEQLEEPMAVGALYASFPVFAMIVPAAALFGAFLWLYFSPEFKRATESAGSNPSPSAAGHPAPRPGTNRPSDPYTQYTLAYQRWQLQYAAFVQSQKPAPQPSAPVQPLDVPAADPTNTPPPPPTA